MINEQMTVYMQTLEARITVLEDFIKAKHPDFPTTPKGTSGTLTPVEPAKLTGWITPTSMPYGANVRTSPEIVKDNIAYNLPFLQARETEGNISVRNIAEGRDYVWHILKGGDKPLYVRGDVVTFSQERPDAPATPINAASWPMPISGYTVTNTHHNHRQHVGIDLAAPIGTKIYSGPNEGYVMKAFRCIPCGDDPTKQMHLGTGEADYGYGLGNYVVVRYYDHPAKNKGHFLFVLYAHLSRINVQEKAALPPYTVIGEVGTSGNSTGPHLHIECRYSDNPLAEFYSIRANEIDPSSIFKA